MKGIAVNTLFSGLIGSKTRIKLLIRLFLNPVAEAYLRELASEFAVSTNAVREELNQLTRTDLLRSRRQGRQVLYSANPEHPLFFDLISMVRKAAGIDQVIESIVTRLGNLEKAYLIDDYARGRDSGIIDLVLVGDIDAYHLSDLTQKTERYIKRKIRSVVVGRDEFAGFAATLEQRPHVLIWEANSKKA
jgi:DNA-binding transcriptional ArsR family regulator